MQRHNEAKRKKSASPARAGGRAGRGEAAARPAVTASSSTCVECGAFDPFTLDGAGNLFCCCCGATVKPPVPDSSHPHREDAKSAATGGAPAVRGDAAGSYAPHGKTRTNPCEAGFRSPVECGVGRGQLDALVCAGCPHDAVPAPRCARTGCGHHVSMHDEGGCALAECSCHEAVAPSGFLALPPLRRLPDGSLRLPDGPPPPSPMVVDDIKLENLTGLASLKLSAFAVTTDGRTTLTVRVGVAS